MVNSNLITALLLSFAGSLFLVAHGSWRFGFGTTKRWYMVDIVGLAAVLATAGIAVDLLDLFRFRFSGPKLTTVNFFCSIWMAVNVWVFWRGGSMFGTGRDLRKNALAWSTMVLSIGMAGWSSYRFQLRSTIPFDFTGVMNIGELVAERSYCGITDRGRHVTLYRFIAPAADLLEFEDTADQRVANFASISIKRKDSDTHSNCHGWVFTHGDYLLNGEGVETILQDNDYQMIDEPIPGDIVIYRNEAKGITHTGLVQGVLQDGTSIIESKWGVGQRFLHRPEDQPYSSDFKFYRSSRAGHLILLHDDIGDDAG